MSRNKKKVETAVETTPVAPLDAVAQLDALSKSLGYAPALSKNDRQKLSSRGSTIPADVIEALAKLAEQHGGVIAGIAFDAAAARDALAKASKSRSVAKGARRLATRATSDAVRRSSLVGDRAMAALQALARMVRTPEGEIFAESYAQMQATMRAKSRRKKRSGAAAKGAAAGTQPAPAKAGTPSPKPATNGVNGAANTAATVS